jgi:hypothetical protein
MYMFFLNILSAHMLKTDFILESCAYFNEQCAKAASKKQELGTKNIYSFSKLKRLLVL